MIAWSEDEASTLVQDLWDAADDQRDQALKVATRAVELVAARGGTMTAAEVRDAEQRSEHGCDPRLFAHIDAQGARVAVLEADATVSATALSVARRQNERVAEERDKALSRLSSLRPLVSQLSALSVEMAKVVGEQPFPDGGTVERLTITGNMHGKVLHYSESFRYPCSPTCTHDDAATPGHAERVKERSEDFVGVACDHGTPIATYCPECAVDTSSPREAYEAGAEAMRAACWEAVQGELRRSGIPRGPGLWERIKAAIEGAAP